MKKKSTLEKISLISSLMFNKWKRMVVMLVIVLFSTLGAKCQQSLAYINLDKIKQQTVKEYIKGQLDNSVKYFADIKSTYKNIIDSSKYSKHQCIYLIKKDINYVWSTYKTMNPAEVWNGKIASFGVLISKKTQRVMYDDEMYEGADTGQILYTNLNLYGLYNLAVAFEIINVNERKKVIEFSYIEGGKSEGKQRIKFVQTKEGHTKVIHSTIYKSGSKFRDKYLYPFFHKQAIDEYHENMFQCIAAI